MTLVTLFGLFLFFSAFLNSRTQQQKIICLYTGPIFILIFGSQLWRDAKIILINTLDNTICFTNLFTRQRTINSFVYFDGYIDMYQSAKGGTYRVIYLVKDRKYIKKISGFYYSNLDELESYLAPLKYMGRQNFNLIKSLKVLLKIPVLH